MVTAKYLKKQVAKRNNIENIENYKKLRKEALQTLLRECLPIDVFSEDIQRPNREEFIRSLNGDTTSRAEAPPGEPETVC